MPARIKKPEYKTLSVRLTKQEYDAFEEYAYSRGVHKSPMAQEILMARVNRKSRKAA